MTGRFQMRKYVLSFKCWKKYVSYLKNVKKKLIYAVNLFGSRHVKYYFQSWAHFCSKISVQNRIKSLREAFALKYINNDCSLNLKFTFLAWKNYVNFKNRHLERTLDIFEGMINKLLESYVGRVLIKLQRLYFKIWINYSSKRKILKFWLKKVFHRLSINLLSRKFRLWLYKVKSHADHQLLPDQVFFYLALFFILSLREQ